MMTDERAARKPVTYPVIHGYGWKADVNYNFVLLPAGAFYHKGLKEARPGDFIRFTDGGKKEIYDVCPLQIHTGVFRNLCRLRYGRESEAVLRQWRRTAVALGHAPSVIDWETCVAVWYKEDSGKGIIEREHRKGI